MFRHSINFKTKVYPCFLITKRTFKSCATSLKSFSISKWYRNIWIPKLVEPPYSHVTQVGDPVLRQISDPVPDEFITSKEINFLITTMINVLRKYECVGLAAPQVGISLRIIVMEFSEKLKGKFSPAVYKTRQMETLPLTVIYYLILCFSI